MRTKTHTLIGIYIRYISVIASKRRRYVFEIKYGHIIAKTVTGGHVTWILSITSFDNLSCYLNKSHKNIGLPVFYTPGLKARQHSIVVCTYPSISLRGNFEALVARRGATLQETMVYEALRLKSFHGIDTANVSTIQLAAAGFYATEHSGEMRCFSCGIRQRIGPQAVGRHQTDCLHRNGLPCGNVTFADCPLASEWNIVRNLPRYPTQDTDLNPPVGQPRMQPTVRQQLPGNVANNPREPSQANQTVPDYDLEAIGVRRRAGPRAPQRSSGEVSKSEGPPGSAGSSELDEVQDRLCRDYRRYNFPVGDRSGSFTGLQVTEQGNTTEVFGNDCMGLGTSLCKICQEHPGSIRLPPCGHLVACVECKPPERCPICRHRLG